MNSEPNAALESLFAPVRTLELTDTEVSAVLERVTVPPPRRPRMRVPRLGNLVTALAALSAIGVAVLALALLGHRNATRAETTTRSIPAAARPLVSELAVLRRPQTAADRSLPAGVPHQLAPSGWRLDPGLTRLAVRLRGGNPLRVYLAVLLPPPTVQRPALAIAIAVPARGTPRNLQQQSATSLKRPSPPARFAYRGPEPGLAGSIVPDGVRRVVWAFAPRGAAVPLVENNIALLRLSRRYLGPTARVLWFGRRGHQIASWSSATTRASARAVEERQVARSDKRPIAPLLIEHFALFRRPQPPGAPPLGLLNEAVFATGGGGLNVGMTRFVHAKDTQPPVGGLPHGVWVIPGSSSVTLFDTHQTGRYFDLQGPRGALSGGAAMPTETDGRHWITGLVPDGNRTVTIILANGASETAPVIDNVYSTALKGRAVELIDRNASGHRVTFRL